MSAMASRLAPWGPSPSELVGARTTAISQPGGASARSRVSPAVVSAQFFDVAARSTTSRRAPSVKAHSEDERAPHQLSGGHLELSGRTRQLELERPVLRVVVHPLVLDHDAVRPQSRLDVLHRRADLCPDRRRDTAAQPADVDLEAP